MSCAAIGTMVSPPSSARASMLLPFLWLAGCMASSIDRDVASASTAAAAVTGRWTWIALPAARCADGSMTGFGIQRASAAEERPLFVYFAGGGACFDAYTCYEAELASHVVGGYDEGDFALDM